MEVYCTIAIPVRV